MRERRVRLWVNLAIAQLSWQALGQPPTGALAHLMDGPASEAQLLYAQRVREDIEEFACRHAAAWRGGRLSL